MKKKLLLFLITLCLFSCNAYENINTHELSVGMEKREAFQILNREPELEYSDQTTEVYRVRKRIVRGGVAEIQQYFLYFDNNKLSKIDKGERAVDYRIRID